MDRMQLIDALLPAIIAAGQSEHDGPQMLHSLSLGELKNMYEKQVASGRIKSETSAEEFVARRAQRAKSIEAEIQKELAERERVQEEAEDRVIRAEAEREADRLLFAWQRQQAQEPQRQAEAAAQQAKDWNTFVEAWRTLRSFSAVQANFHLIRQVLGPNFSVYQIKQALDSNAIQLAPPTQVELDNWYRDDVEARESLLKNADPVTLRKIVREEGAQSRAAHRQAEADQQLEAQIELDRAMNFPPLPKEIGRQEIRNASADRLQFWKNRYGWAQLNLRIRGLI